MTYQEALQFIREQQSQQAKKGDVKMRLLEIGVPELEARNLLGYAYRTQIIDSQIIENINKGIYYKEFLEGNMKNILKEYEKKGKLKTSIKNKEKGNYSMGLLPLFIFWLGLIMLFFNFYVALAIIFVSSFLFLKGDYKEKGLIVNVATSGKFLWNLMLVFGGLTLIALFLILYSSAN